MIVSERGGGGGGNIPYSRFRGDVASFLFLHDSEKILLIFKAVHT